MVVFRNKSRCLALLNKLSAQIAQHQGDRREDMGKIDMVTNISNENTGTSFAIENADGEFLDELNSIVSTMLLPTVRHELNMEVRHVQLLYQIWRKKPGVRAARTIVITSSLFILLEEDLRTVRVNLKLISWTDAKHVQKIISDTKYPLQITFVLLGAENKHSLSFTRKWRLQAESRESLRRLKDECKRVCADQGNLV